MVIFSFGAVLFLFIPVFRNGIQIAVSLTVTNCTIAKYSFANDCDKRNEGEKMSYRRGPLGRGEHSCLNGLPDLKSRQRDKPRRTS